MAGRAHLMHLGPETAVHEGSETQRLSVSGDGFPGGSVSETAEDGFLRSGRRGKKNTTNDVQSKNVTTMSRFSDPSPRGSRIALCRASALVARAY